MCFRLALDDKPPEKARMNDRLCGRPNASMSSKSDEESPGSESAPSDVEASSLLEDASDVWLSP
jgi:hypothetical protein